MNKFCRQLKQEIEELKKLATNFDLPDDIVLTKTNIGEWINRFRNIYADMGDHYDIVYELLEIMQFMDRLHKLSREVQSRGDNTNTGIVDPISPEVSEKYLSYDTVDASLYISDKSNAYRNWLFMNMDRLIDLNKNSINIVFDGDLDISTLNFVYPHFINILQNYAMVDGMIILSEQQAQRIGRQILDALTSSGRFRGWNTPIK